MKKTFLIFFSIFALIVNISLAADIRIAVVDVKEILKESKAAKDLKEKLDSGKKRFIDQRKKEESKIRKAEQELINQKNIVASDVFKKKTQEFEQKYLTARKNVTEKAVALENNFKEELVKVQKEALEIISDIARKEKYDIVFDYNQVLFNNPKFDITREVMKQINRSMPRVGSIK